MTGIEGTRVDTSKAPCENPLANSGNLGKWKESPLKAHCLLLPGWYAVGCLSWRSKMREAGKEESGVSDCRWWYHTWEIPKPPETQEIIWNTLSKMAAYKTNVWKSEASLSTRKTLRGNNPIHSYIKTKPSCSTTTQAVEVGGWSRLLTSLMAQV